MSEEPDKVAYHRALYAKSERERLYRINHSRRQRGAPEIGSLSETRLRIPLGGR
jgi:hypothetical protein